MRYDVFAVGSAAVIVIALLVVADFVLHKIRPPRDVEPSPTHEETTPAPLSPALQDTTLDIDDITDAWAILEKGELSFTREQVVRYLQLQTTYQNEIEARS